MSDNTIRLDENKCGIVILNYNSHDLTVALAEKICDFSSVSDICVVDNCSNDDFEDDFTNPKIHYIKNTKNTGYSAGNNVGLRYLVNKRGCGYVFIANPDVFFEDSTIKAMHEQFLATPSLALLSTKRFGHDGAQIHQYFDFPTLGDSIKNCFFLARKKFEKRRHFNQNRKIDLSDDIVFVDAVPGAFFGIKSEFLLKNGFIYEGIFLYGEEIILGRQAHNLGYKAGVINNDFYIHDHVQKRFSNKKMFWYDRHSLKIYYKLFEKYNPLQWLCLNTAIVLGTFEYNCAYGLYHLIKKGKK